MQQSYPNQLCSLFVVCFHSFSPTSVSKCGYIRGGERETATSNPPFFRDFRWHPSGVSHLVFAWLFPVIDRIYLEMTKNLSQFGNKVTKVRLVNTASTNFDATARITNERSQQKNRFCIVLLKTCEPISDHI